LIMKLKIGTELHNI